MSLFQHCIRRCNPEGNSRFRSGINYFIEGRHQYRRAISCMEDSVHLHKCKKSALVLALYYMLSYQIMDHYIEKKRLKSALYYLRKSI